MNFRIDAVPNVYLKAGEFFISSGPACVTTVLGSCLAVTMFNERLRIWAICHALLPTKNGNNDDFKYVDSSIVRMLKEFKKVKIGRQEIDVKLFGGADMFKIRNASGALQPSSVGGQNIKAALETLEKEGLSIAASDVGGKSGRKLYYFTPENRVFIKRLDRLAISPGTGGPGKME